MQSSPKGQLGFVFFPLIPAIMRERVTASTTSAILKPLHRSVQHFHYYCSILRHAAWETPDVQL